MFRLLVENESEGSAKESVPAEIKNPSYEDGEETIEGIDGEISVLAKLNAETILRINQIQNDLSEITELQEQWLGGLKDLISRENNNELKEYILDVAKKLIAIGSVKFDDTHVKMLKQTAAQCAGLSIDTTLNIPEPVDVTDYYGSENIDSIYRDDLDQKIQSDESMKAILENDGISIEEIARVRLFVQKYIQADLEKRITKLVAQKNKVQEKIDSEL